MRSITFLIVNVIIAFVVINSAVASITTLNENIFYDDISNLYWFRDPNSFKGFTEGEQTQLLNNFEVINNNSRWYDWRYATQQEITDLSYYNGQIPFDFFHNWETNNSNHYYISGHTTSSDEYYGEDITLTSFYGITVDQITYEKWFSDNSTEYGAFIVTDTMVPIPYSIFLLGSGLFGLAGIIKRKKC